MRLPALSLLFFCFGATALALGGCGKDPPPKPIDEPKKTTPVPSDMVFNDFLPQNGPATGIAVRDAGGLPDAGGEGASAAGEANKAPEEGTLKLVEPGAEPRSKRKYTFVANRTDKRVITLRQSMSQQGGRADEPPALQISVDLTPKAVKPTGTAFEMKIAKVDLAEKEKVNPQIVQQAAQQLGVFTGLTATFDVSPQGTVSEISFAANEKMQKSGAAELVDGFQQAVELMLPPLPVEAIGQGAKWERSTMVKARGAEQSSKSLFELKEVTAEGGTILATITTKVPKRSLPDPRVPKGATVEVDGKGAYTYAFRFDHISSKVSGELTNLMKIEVPVPDSKEKQSVVQEVKLKHLIETPGGK